jgi:DNA-binding beta-propeller fold protein YncE
MHQTSHPSSARAAAAHRTAACGLSAALLAAAGAAHAQSYRFVSQFGTTGPGTLDFPNDIQIDPATRNIYVSDTGHDRVVVFDSAGNYATSFGSSGSGDGQFDYPAGIGIDPVSHEVLVADYFGHRVQRFTANGSFLGKFGPNQTWTPCAISIRPGNRDILVSNGFGAGVLVYDVNRNFLGQFGSSSNFDDPCDMAFAANGHIIVGDQTNHNVQMFDSGGGYLGAFGGFGSADGKFNSPGGVDIDATTSNIVVADYGNDRIQVFDANGNFLGKFGSQGSGPGQFDGPNGIAIDPISHDLLVDDRGNNRIQRFAACGPTLVSLSVLPLTQALNQAVFFSASIGNVESPSGTIAMYSDGGGLICTATTYGDPQAACSGYLTLGSHTVTAVYSGTGIIPSGCSQSVPVTVVDTQLTTTSSYLLLQPSNPSQWLQGKPITLTGSLFPPPPAPATPTAPSVTHSGFFTFYDGSTVIARVPLDGDQAQFANAFAGGSHQFKAVYSGDGNYASSDASDSVAVIAPDDGIFYNGLEVPPGS